MTAEDWKIDPDRLTFGDLKFFDRAARGETKVTEWSGFLARLTGRSEADIDALPLRQFHALMAQLKDVVGALGSEASGES